MSHACLSLHSRNCFESLIRLNLIKHNCVSFISLKQIQYFFYGGLQHLLFTYILYLNTYIFFQHKKRCWLLLSSSNNLVERDGWGNLVAKHWYVSWEVQSNPLYASICVVVLIWFLFCLSTSFYLSIYSANTWVYGLSLHCGMQSDLRWDLRP